MTVTAMTLPGATPSRASALVQLVLVVGVLLAVKELLLRFDAIWSYAGPIALLVGLGVATTCLRRDAQTWADLGAGRPGRPAPLALRTIVALGLTIVAGVAVQSLATIAIGAPDTATQAIDARYQDRFSDVPGNLTAFLFWLAIAWIIGGFTEEMLFRGFLFSRSEHVLRGAPCAAILAVIPQAVLFGQQHFYYQGMAGWVANGVMAAVSGLLYLAFDRRLWPLILSHGLSNTIGLTVLFLS